MQEDSQGIYKECLAGKQPYCPDTYERYLTARGTFVHLLKVYSSEVPKWCMSLSHSNFWEHLDSKMHGILLKVKPHLGLRLSRKCTSDTFRGIDLIISLLHFHTPKYPYRLSPMPHKTLYFTTVTISRFITLYSQTKRHCFKVNEEEWGDVSLQV